MSKKQVTSGNPVIHLGAADFLGSPDKFPR